MASKKRLMLAFFLVGLAIALSRSDHDHANKKVSFMEIAAPAPAPASPDLDTLCSDIIFNMLDCLDFLTEGSTIDKPGDSCCLGAESVLEFNGQCICVALKTSSALGYVVNMTRVESLASLCSLKPYPLEKCSISGLPGSSPLPSPVESPDQAPEPDVPSPPPIEKPEPETPTPAPAQTPDTSSAPTCAEIMFNTIDCVGYISKGSTEDQPEPTCCPGLKSVMDFSHECVCEAMQSSSQLGIELNMTRVQDLPSICGLQGFPIEKCGLDSASPSPIQLPTPSPLKSEPTPSPPKSEPTQSPPKSRPAPSPSKSEDPTKPGSKIEAPSPTPKHSGCHTLGGFSVAALVSTIAIVYILSLHL